MSRDCRRGGAEIYFLGLQFTSLQIQLFLLAALCQGHFISSLQNGKNSLGGESELP